MRGRPLTALLLPGLPRLLRGHRTTGGVTLLLWFSLWILLAVRWQRVVEATRGTLGERIAVGVLVLGLLGLPALSMRWESAGGAGSAADAKEGGAASEGGAGDSQEPGRTVDEAGRRPGRGGGWPTVAAAFRRNRLAILGLLAIGAFYLVALLTPLIAPYDPTVQGDLVSGANLPPSLEHPLGTDQYARDVLTRVLYGARISLSVGFVAVAISVTIGTAIGATAGYVGGRVDGLLMRFVDMVLSFPRLVLLIAVIAMLERPSIFLIVAILGLTLWPSSARIVRGEVLALREREFVEAARALGYSGPRILVRHVLPNALGPVIVAATLGIGNTIVLEAGLSFLGIGVQPPTPSWGNMVADGRTRLLDAWWISTFPGFAIVFTVLAFNLVGDGLRDALDPRLQGEP